MKIMYKYSAAAAAMFAIGMLLYGSRAHEKPALAPIPRPEKPVLSVTLATPVKRLWNTSVNVTGAFAPWQEAVIAAETGSLRITAILADVGTRVRRGQLVATLDARSILADSAKHRALVAQASAALQQARADALRAQQVKDTGSLSEQAIAQYMALEQTTKANLAAAEADLQNDRIRLAQTRVLAADDGVISSRSALLGNVIPVGAELFKMVRQNRVEWRAEVAPSQLPGMSIGQAVSMTVNGAAVAGKVRMISPTLSNDTRLAIVYVDVATSSGVQAGSYAGGSIITGRSPALTLPASALVTRDGQHYVFVVAAHGATVKQQAVVTGRRQDGAVEITRGLREREKVVESGGIFLGDGDQVAIGAGRVAPGGKGE